MACASTKPRPICGEHPEPGRTFHAAWSLQESICRFCGAISREMSAADAILTAMNTRSSSLPVRLDGFATYAELLASGLSRRRIRTMLQRGELISPARGVYITP